MKDFHEWLKNNEAIIKDQILRIAAASGLTVKYLGFYAEPNIQSGSFVAEPIFSSIEDYESKNDSGYRIDYARLFFTTYDGSDKRQLTLSISQNDLTNFNFSIEEFGIELNVIDPSDINFYYDLKTLFSKKFFNVINKIEELNSKIISYGKLSDTQLNKLHFKIRLDWNYYSNRMEGGTLTKPETKQVMAGVSVGAKTLNDVYEMTGHDQAVQEILHIAKGDLRISEKRIKHFHELIMREDDPEKAKLIGKWKKENNEVINFKGEKQLFLDHSLVPDKMHETTNQLNADLDRYFRNDKNARHPLHIATDFHLDYLYIHPFYDGNGRTARLLTNLILIACGYPPIIITDDTKEAYYRLISQVQTYGADKNLIYEFLGKQVIRTQQLYLDVLEGRDISEEDDLDKVLTVFEQSINTKEEKHKIEKRQKVKVGKLLYHAFLPIIQEMNKTFKVLTKHFAGSEIEVRKAKEDKRYNALPDDLELLLQDVDLESVGEIEVRFELQKLKAALPSNVYSRMIVLMRFNQFEAFLDYDFSVVKEKRTLYYGDEIEEENFVKEARSLLVQYVSDLNEQIKAL